jgi:biotin-dependent carboxylase-like uncharacterized protein
MITVIQSGEFTTIQDKGRFGYQAYGMPVAGAMDQYAFCIANLLAGNNADAAVLEMTDNGVVLKFDEAQMVAVCGADMQGKLNDVPVANWSSFFVPRNGILKFGAAKTGRRTYLAVRGGIEVPVVLGSRSTYTRAGIGGHEGRILRQGDVLYVGEEAADGAKPQKLQPLYIPQYTSDICLRVLLGPQDNMFSADAIKTFFTNKYTVAPQSDRAGYQLKGSRIKTIGKTDIVSDAVCMGAIQIPAYGRPLIVTADHQTTRGFAKIGCVIRADLDKLAQAKPEDTIHFSQVSEPEAIEALLLRKMQYDILTDQFTAIQ